MVINMRTFPGNGYSFTVSDGSTVNNVKDLFADRYRANNGGEFSLSGKEVRLNGEVITDFNTIVYDGASIMVTTKKDSSMEEEEEEQADAGDSPVEIKVVIPKKKDTFTKKFCEESTDDELKIALYIYALNAKCKNRHLQARRYSILDTPKPIEINGVQYDTYVEANERHGRLMITSDKEIYEGQAVEYFALESETELELIKRWNSAN